MDKTNRLRRHPNNTSPKTRKETKGNGSLTLFLETAQCTFSKSKRTVVYITWTRHHMTRQRKKTAVFHTANFDLVSTTHD